MIFIRTKFDGFGSAMHNDCHIFEQLNGFDIHLVNVC
jgi:hypothetical protein